MDLNLDAHLAAELRALEEAQLRRTLRPETGARNFASNDYLGLRRHPALVEAGCAAAQELGTGAGASRLVCGNDAAVMALEAEMAAWKEKEAALLFTSGYAAALGVIPALMKKGDTIIVDKLSHACLIDGARLSGATLRVFPHNQVGRLEELLQGAAGEGGRVLVVTESIFSMDGDAAPLREIVALKERYGAWLLVDEAHATGLYGATGAGLVAELGLSDRVEVIMATMGKALGSAGGIIAGSRTLIDFLINRARSFIYSTALPPSVVAGGRAAIALARGPEGAAFRGHLRENVTLFRRGLGAHWSQPPGAEGAIQPLLCGEAEAALRLSRGLLEQGFLIPAIRYPTVPRKASRLRVTLSAGHTEDDISGLLRALSSFPIEAD